MLWTALLLGLTGSFHCIGMCGPIAFVIPVNKQSNTMVWYQTFLYHWGRILTYGFMGLLFGLIGKGLYLSGFQQNLSILAGVTMIVVILFPGSRLNTTKLLRPFYHSIQKIKHKLGFYLSKKSNKSIFTIGFLNGFLPCGLVYMALVGSIASAGVLKGALYMVLFGLGTIPMMTAAVLFGNFVNLSLRKKIHSAIPVFVVIIGLLFILRGLGLGIPYISPSDAKLQISNNPVNCVTIEMIDSK